MCSGFVAADLNTARAEAYNNNPEAEQTNSKRIEVYSLSQNYWDVQYGDTLGGIAHHLLFTGLCHHAVDDRLVDLQVSFKCRYRPITGVHIVYFQ